VGNHPRGPANNCLRRSDLGWDSVGILLNNGNANFAPVSYHPTGGEGFGDLIAEDLNGDCCPDVAVLAAPSGPSILINDGLGAFLPPVQYKTGDAQPNPNNAHGRLWPLTPIAVDSTSSPSYRYAEGSGCNDDSTVMFSCRYFAPKHPDSAGFIITDCLLVVWYVFIPGYPRPSCEEWVETRGWPLRSK
jgi:hypothetical protein